MEQQTAKQLQRPAISLKSFNLKSFLVRANCSELLLKKTNINVISQICYNKTFLVFKNCTEIRNSMRLRFEIILEG